MRTKRLGIGAAALFVLAVAACSGNSNPTPVYPTSGGGTAGSTPVSMVAVGGYSGYVSVTASYPPSPSPAPTAPVTASLSLTAPSGVTPLSNKRPAVDTSTPDPQVYMTITAGAGGVTIKSIAPTISLPSPVPAGKSLYLAIWTGSAWKTVGSPTSTPVSGSTATYSLASGTLNPLVTLAEGASVVFGFYEGTYSYPSPVPTPTPTPTPVPTPTPAGNAVVNGDFETGSLAPWTKCSYAHTGYQAPVNATPAPMATATQNPAVTPPLTGTDLDPYVTTTPPPPNYNPNQTGTSHPNFGTTSALTGSLNAQVNAATGICQVITVPTNGQLTYWAYEGGTAYNFYNGDQEAQILDSTGTTVLYTPVVELNCYYDSVHFPTEPTYASSGCFPADYGGTSAYNDWSNGGYWVQRGPYNLSSLAGQTVTLFLGTWSSATHAGPVSYANFMFVDNVTVQPPPT